VRAASHSPSFLMGLSKIVQRHRLVTAQTRIVLLTLHLLINAGSLSNSPMRL